MKPIVRKDLTFGGGVHTLAQKKTVKPLKSLKKPVISVHGTGSDVSNSNINFARNKRKLITQKIALALVDIAIKKGQPERAKDYWNAYYCLNHVVSDGNRLYSKYCKQRICTVCSGNRKAELINKYLPIINKWEEPYFVTLTLKSVPANRLNAMMRAVLRGLKLIIDKYGKRSCRGKGIRLKGVRSLECNFNPVRRTYNPHFHIIVANEQMADILIKEWRYYCNRKGKFWASKKAQDKRKVFNNETCLIEVIKYGSKIFTRPDMDNNSKYEIPPKVYIAALHNILTSMKGLRLFERFGFNLPKQQKNTSEKILTEYDLLKYDKAVMDWVDMESDLRLCEYNLPPDLKFILNSNLDSTLE